MITNELLIKYLNGCNGDLTYDDDIKFIMKITNEDLMNDSDRLICVAKYNLYKSVNEFINFVLKKNIDNIVFLKGIFLGNLLYDNPECRPYGDVDIFAKKDIHVILKKLVDAGFSRVKGYNNEAHHMLLSYNGILVELHHTIIDPRIEIAENRIIEDINQICLDDYQYNVLSVNGMLLHLLYHLYMDYCIEPYFYKYLFQKEKFIFCKRELFREYEISLFCEKYYSQIDWSLICDDLKKQKLFIPFKYMFNNILNKFPLFFNDKLCNEVVPNLQYRVNNIDQAFLVLLVEKKLTISEVAKEIVNHFNKDVIIFEYEKRSILLKYIGFSEGNLLTMFDEHGNESFILFFTLADGAMQNYLFFPKFDGKHIICDVIVLESKRVFRGFMLQISLENNQIVLKIDLKDKCLPTHYIKAGLRVSNFSKNLVEALTTDC